MDSQKEASALWCGIDVSKTSLDIYLPGSNVRQWQVRNSTEGCQELVEQLLDLKCAVRVIMEATGGMERKLVAALTAAEIVVIVVNPRQARRFAEALAANPAKTDRADARMLSLMGSSLNLEPRQLPTEDQRELSELVARRRQLVDMLSREKMRLQQTATVRVRRDIQSTIDWLKERISDIDDDMGEKLQSFVELQEIETVVRTEKGVGSATARVLVACLPELGRLSRSAIASLVGVAPIARDSGTSSKRRRICGGRSDVRSALWMATFNARQKNDKIKAMYERLLAKGKPYKVAMIACAHKLLTILNALVRNHLRTVASTSN